ncbi:FAD-dependent oxidoreductase [Desulfogranum mediterraneum]|uniref:FAD-dependent oxidoreductase n=1 Tax=Desulfogranum mediterraneum TaxID=160661 RepID=UPI000421BF81|nr:FAD-dependent oxidoreductase [Desulfogranum mediterraneum]
MTSTNLVVIGGSAAGAKAAAKAKRLNEAANVTIIQKGADLSMAACGYPYYVGGVFDERKMLLCTPTGVVRDPAFFAKAKGITALTETEVMAIDREQKRVHCLNLRTREEQTIPYDKLIIATGASANLPPIPNIDLDGIHTLLSMEDSDALRRIRDAQQVKKAVIIGGGLIGVETCEALQLSGMEVTVVELQDQVLPFLDWRMAKLVENHMHASGATILTSTGLKEFRGKEGKLSGVVLADGSVLDCELAVMAMGVRPNSGLAARAGLAIGKLGGISVDQYMQSSDPHIYAAGDCVEINNCNTGDKTFSPMGDLANLEGRVAGENVILGNSVTFPGTYQTGICKIFNFTAGSTGLSEKVAQQTGFSDYETVVNASPDKPGFMGAKLLISKLLVSTRDQRILGYQCVGPGDVSKQIAMAAMAIQGKMTVEQLVNADLPYAPPFSLAIDHFIASAHIIQNKLKGRMKGTDATAVWERIQQGEELFLMDARSPEEFEEMQLGIGEKLVPLGAVRARLEELPADKEQEIICFCKISMRGYETATILRAHGYTNVRVMEGGLMAWPYPRKR